jgi:hypothetical protein
MLQLTVEPRGYPEVIRDGNIVVASISELTAGFSREYTEDWQPQTHLA